MHIQEPEKDDPYTVIDARELGKIAHGLLESICPNTNHDEFIFRCKTAFENYLRSRPPMIPGNAESLKDDFIEMMENGLEQDPGHTPIAIEEELEAVHPSGVVIKGYTDRIECTKDGKYIIVEYKTGSKLEQKADDVNSCLQAIIYAYLVGQAKLSFNSSSAVVFKALTISTNVSMLIRLDPVSM